MAGVTQLADLPEPETLQVDLALGDLHLHQQARRQRDPAVSELVSRPVLRRVLVVRAYLARQLSIQNHAVVLFGADGTVRKQMDGIVLSPKPGLEDYLQSKLQ